MSFTCEKDFETALINLLTQHGWEKEIIYNFKEKDLIENWKKIIDCKNQEKDRLNNQPLTELEMKQIIDQINSKTPYGINGFINGKFVTIKRDNGKEVSLEIFNSHIASGKTRYQIASQPKFKTSEICENRIGDLLLLINGMPVVSVELKKSGISISRAIEQIKKYNRQKAYNGIFKLIQIFVAMNPEEAVYFANPGESDENNKFNSDYQFHWADFNNIKINEWKAVARNLLSIPMVHELITNYTIADKSDSSLKVMRSYQYYAARKILEKVQKHNWEINNNRGGYIWHTTGSGKTMTSFKCAQLIANDQKNIKVIFLVDRITLAIQTFREHQNFAKNIFVQETNSISALVKKMKSDDPKDILIVTSIQKMKEIKINANEVKTNDIKIMQSKKIVFIVDEAHRSVFGEMMHKIKATFNKAIFFGFTGTPIHHPKSKLEDTTANVFGDELHRYSIADGINDKNVLGFDLYKVSTFKDGDLRKAVIFNKLKIKDISEIANNEARIKMYNRFMDKSQISMLDIKEKISQSQYENSKHQNMVVDNILTNWQMLSRNSKFHAIFATMKIKEAIEYYRLFKAKNPDFQVNALFDSHFDGNDDSEFKELGLKEIINDYNKKYQTTFEFKDFDKFRKDIVARLAHKEPYLSIQNTIEKQINLVIVVNQLLTGYDSKWINTLYLDKTLESEHVIQAFSRTNRLFGKDKPFGLFVPKIKEHVEKMNEVFVDMQELFQDDNQTSINFNVLPKNVEAKKQFANLFNKFNELLEASKIQGFKWSDLRNDHFSSPEQEIIKVNFKEDEYIALAQRYKELDKEQQDSLKSVPYDIDGNWTEINTDLIDASYMNAKFDKFLAAWYSGDQKLIEQIEQELHITFATFSQQDQKIADIILFEIKNGKFTSDKTKTIKDYIIDYKNKIADNKKEQIVNCFGLNRVCLNDLLSKDLKEQNINEYNTLDTLYKSGNLAMAENFFYEKTKEKWSKKEVNIQMKKIIRNFVLYKKLDKRFFDFED